MTQLRANSSFPSLKNADVLSLKHADVFLANNLTEPISQSKNLVQPK